MINFYRRFIPNCSTILQPLTNIQQKKNRNISLETDVLHAFNTAKAALVNFTKLSYIKDNPQICLTLTTDALDTSVGALVEQECGSTQTYRILFSQALTCTEKVQHLFMRVAGHILGSQTCQTSSRRQKLNNLHKPQASNNSNEYQLW